MLFTVDALFTGVPSASTLVGLMQLMNKKAHPAANAFFNSVFL